MIFGALRQAQDTITDLRRRLDDATADNRRLTDRLLNFHQPEPTPTVDHLDGVMLPSNVMDEIELVASSGAMARHLERWALIELRKGVGVATVIERIREGDSVTVPAAVEDE